MFKDLTTEAEFEVARGGAVWFLGVRSSIQKADHGNSLPRLRHQVCTDFRELIPVSMTDPVAVNLKDLCHW